MLYDEFNSIQSDIDDHNVAAATWDTAATAYKASIAKYEKDVSDKCDTCCDKQQASVEAIEYTPGYASCDYTSADADKCTDVAKANVATAVKADFAAGLKRYNDLDSGCTQMTNTVAADLSDMNDKNDHCDDSQAECVQRQGAIAQKKSQFESDWASTLADYKEGINERENNFTDTSSRVHQDEADRVDEWQSTQEIKCLLQSFMSGGSFDEAQMNTCKGQIQTSHLVIDYPVIPARVQWPLDDYHDMTDTSPYAEDCQLEENADEAADTRCSLKDTPADATCDKTAADDGPAWTLSTAGASFVQ